MLITTFSTFSDGASQSSFLNLFYWKPKSGDSKSAKSSWLQCVSLEQVNLLAGIFRAGADLNFYRQLIGTIQESNLRKVEYISLLAYLVLFNFEDPFELETVRSILFAVYSEKSGTKLELSKLIGSLINMSAFIQVSLNFYNLENRLKNSILIICFKM